MSLVTYFQQVKIPGHLGPSSVTQVRNSPTDFSEGAGRRAFCLPLGEAESGPAEAAAETVGLQGAGGDERALF